MKLSAIILMVIALGASAAYADEVCISSASDPDGDGSGVEQETSCRVGTETDQIPVRFDPHTAEQINIERLVWTDGDFADRSFGFCHGVVVDPFGEKTCPSCTNQRMDNTSHEYQHNADGTGRLQVESDNPAEAYDAVFEWSIDEAGLYSGPLPIEAYGERFDGGVRFWLEGIAGVIGFYTECRIEQPEALAKAVCVDSDGDGWGWDGTDSCRVENESPAGACVDSDGDGFGWNGAATCELP